ncbi:MAG TPA: YihY/virulence factor BrkB family protein [Anaerolineae bacterium]|nr:YihY/virulence factor BrkB family protein [Anaerolineae bacterium]
MNLRNIWSLLKDTIAEWNAHAAPRLAAALAYYTAFSLAPLLVLVIALAGLVLGQQQAAQAEILNQVRQVLGDEGARFVGSMIAGLRNPASSTLAALVGVATLLFGALGVFTELQATLNLIWGVTAQPTPGLRAFIQERLLAFTLVLVIAFLLLISLVISAGLAAVGRFLNQLLPEQLALLQFFNAVFSFAIITLLIALIFRILPQVKIAWSEVWLGAAVTSLLFTIGQHLIGLYLGNSSAASVYGAAGTFVVLLLWVYYSAQIFYFGAEFTQVYANKYKGTILWPGEAVSVESQPGAAPHPASPQRGEERRSRSLEGAGWGEGEDLSHSQVSHHG